MNVTDWSRYREAFPVTDRYAYFQHAAVTALPRPSQQNLRSVSQDMMTHGCLHERDWIEMTERTRHLGARVLGSEPDRVSFVHNTSHGLSLIAESIPWNPGDRVLVPVGEFPANVYPWMNQARKGVRLDRVPLRDGGVHRDTIREAVHDDTRVLALSSVQFHNGFRSRLDRLGSFCRERGIRLVVDAIQSLGWDPLPLRDLPVDAAVGDAHKWLCGPEGVGLCYLSESFQETIQPALVGWKSVTDPYEFDSEHFTLRTDASVLEEGSPNTLGIAALKPSLELLLEAGLEAIRDRCLDLHRRASDALRARGFELAHRNWTEDHRSPILCFRHPNVDPSRLVEHCRNRRVQLSLRRGRARAGLHFYNNRNDIDKLIDAVTELL